MRLCTAQPKSAHRPCIAGLDCASATPRCVAKRSMNSDGHAQQLFHSITDAADNAHIGVLVLRQGLAPEDVDILYLNRTTEELLGCAQSEVVSRGFWSFIPKGEAATVRAIQEALTARAQVPPTLRTSYVHRDGREIPVDVALGTVELDGRAGAVLFLSDVSDRRTAEAALRSSEARFRALVTSAPDAILILRWPYILFVNPEGARLLELESCDAAVGVDIRRHLSADHVRIAEERLKLQATGVRVVAPYEYQGVASHGKLVEVDVSTMPIEFENGPATLVYARDVTERNLILARLREAEKLTAVHSLAAGVAHEINNPLSYVLLNLEFLERELPDLGGDPARVAALQRRLADTRHGAERVKHIVRDLQALTRKDEMIRGQVELDQILDHTLHLLRRELQQGITVTTDFAEAPCVVGNPTRIEQLFSNLLLNAAHALQESDAPERSLKVTLRAGNGHVLTEITDNGCGMTEQVLSRAFEPFFTTKALGIGAGLGLAICRRIVDDLAGRIEVDSRPLSGTTVRVYLPSCDSAPRARPTPQPAAARGRVLLVDDERAVAESLRHALHDELDVETAGSARDARALLEAGKHFDAVLCDLTMPEETGADFFEYVRVKYPSLAKRFVFMSGGVFNTNTHAFLEHSGCAHVEKPFSLDHLRALLAQLIAAPP
jgi:PAS domain S-box-containing protein